MTRRYLILGSEGFIGSSVCRVLDTHPGLGVAIRHVRGPVSLQSLHSWDRPHVLDLESASADEIDVLLAWAAPQVVVNCVGMTTGTRAEMVGANIRVVRNLIAGLAKRPDVHLIQLGSAAEYGKSVRDRPAHENDLPDPISDYGRTKLDATRSVLGAVDQGLIRGTVLRVFNPVGFGSSPETLLGSAVVRMELALREQATSLRFGPLSGYRDFIDVRDVAWAAVTAGYTSTVNGSLLNVGRGHAVQCSEMIMMLAERVGFGGRIEETEGGSDRSASLDRQVADVAAIRDQLSWQARYSLEDALESLWSSVRPVGPH